MKKTNFCSYLVFVICFYLTSCVSSSKYIYTPSTPNLLLLEEKNSAKIAINYATSSTTNNLEADNKKSNGVDVQTAYAITKNVGLKFDFYNKWEFNQPFYTTNQFSTINYKKHGFEISTGIYNFTKNPGYSGFQLYAGFGKGKFLLNETSSTNKNYFNMDYQKFFVQPSFTLKASAHYNFTFAARLNAINYKNLTTNYSNLANDVLGYIQTKTSIFTDFIIQNEFCFKKAAAVKFQIQLGTTRLHTYFSSVSTATVQHQQYLYNNNWASFGVITDIQKLTTKKK